MREICHNKVVRRAGAFRRPGGVWRRPRGRRPGPDLAPAGVSDILSRKFNGMADGSPLSPDLLAA